MAMEEAVWGRIVIIGKDGKERKAEMELEDVEGDPYLFGRCASLEPASSLRHSTVLLLSSQCVRPELICFCALVRAKTSDICINMPSVSRKHAALSKDAQGQVSCVCSAPHAIFSSRCRAATSVYRD